MAATFWEFFVPTFAAFILGGLVVAVSSWFGLGFILVCFLQLYILDKRDPDGLYRIWLRKRGTH